jgi:signal transduction histidine kinase
MTLPLRLRFALLAAMLVVLVASLVGLAGYLALRSSLLDRTAGTAKSEAGRLLGLVDGGGNTNGQVVDITDTSLTRQLSQPGLRVEVVAPGGAVIQSAPVGGHAGTVALPAALRDRCLSSGQAQSRLRSPPLAVACTRVGSARAPKATIVVGVPLQDALASLTTLRTTLVLGVLGGGLLAALLSLVLARRALRPLKRIALTAETIRSGDLTRRIDHGARDEVGQLADVLDACFAELEGAIDRQRRFAADASHELRTPLAAIQANVEVLRDWAAADPAAREAALEALDQSSRRASRLVADLLVLVRLDREPDRRRLVVRLDEVVLGAVREAGPLRRDVDIRVARLDDALVPAGDPMALQQVLLNVIENALQVSPSGSEVVVSLVATTHEARVTVSDNGPGIPPGDLERVFHRFYSRPVNTASRSGAGLGLAIALAIAREHGGTLTASNNSGPGATFVLGLPLGPVPVDPVAPAPPEMAALS